MQVNATFAGSKPLLKTIKFFVMIRSLFKIGLMLVAGILIYNFFFGTDVEKEQSRKVFGQVRGVVVSVGDLLRSEKAKFDAGKYDGALDKLGGAYRAVREQAQHVDQSVLKRLDELEQRKADLQEEVHSIEQGDQQAAAQPAPKKGLKKDPKAESQASAKAADQQRRKEQAQRDLERLVKDSDELLQEAGQ